MSYHIQKQEKETQKLNFFSSHTPKGHFIHLQRCPAHLAAAGCTAWMKNTRRPIWGPIFSLLITVISDKLDPFD